MGRPSRSGTRGLFRMRTLLVGCMAVLAVACRPAHVMLPPDAGRNDAVVVGSFNFPESRLLAEIYAGALEQSGLKVDRQLDLGPRELVAPALRQGLVDIVPEYLGSALDYADSGSATDRANSDAVRLALEAAVRPWGVQVLQPAAAQNQNALAVTRVASDSFGLRKVSDLAPRAGSLTFTGPAECAKRPQCLPGLAEVYGIHFGNFVVYDTEAQRVAALAQRLADVALLFTTDGYAATGDYVMLDDDRHLQPVENIVPLVSGRANSRWGGAIATALNGVSGRLSSEALTFLNWRVAVAGRDPATEARGWLQRQGLVGGR